MERKYANHEEALDVAKEAVWLAWNAAGGPSGSGFLRDRPEADKEAVWDNAFNMGDYAGRTSLDPSVVHADYVFGRMLKLNFTMRGDTLTFRDSEPHRDYQGWCGKYKSYTALFDAAEEQTETVRV